MLKDIFQTVQFVKICTRGLCWRWDLIMASKENLSVPQSWRWVGGHNVRFTLNYHHDDSLGIITTFLLSILLNWIQNLFKWCIMIYILFWYWRSFPSWILPEKYLFYIHFDNKKFNKICWQLQAPPKISILYSLW